MKLTYTGSVVKSQFSDSVSTKGHLKLQNNQEDVFTEIENATLFAHDIEHLICGLGYSEVEERIISQMRCHILTDNTRDSVDKIQKFHPNIDLNEWVELFNLDGIYMNISHKDLCGLTFKLTCTLDNYKVYVDFDFN